MPRTKYIASFFSVLVTLLVIVFIYNALKNSESSFNLPPTERALAIEAISGGVPGVVVKVNTVREDTRRSLIEKLRNFAPTKDKVRVEREKEETPQPPRSSITTVDKEPLFCADGSESGSGVTTWGPVNVTQAEGARVVSSRAIADDGQPLQSLQLTDHPVIANTNTCLPKGMIGIALDGRVIEAGMPFMTSAEGVAGYALDGFAIYGPFENGIALNSEMLDSCHGHVHPIVWNDTPVSMYHYHVTNDPPYTLSCFRGSPTTRE